MTRSSNYSGGSFQDQFKSSAGGFGLCFRIPDSTFVVKREFGVTMGSRKSPADFFWFVPQNKRRSIRVYMVEAKATAERRIDFSRLEPHQREALSEFSGLSDKTFGYIAVNMYDSQNVRETNRLFMVPVETWVELEETLDRKSIPLRVLEEREEIIECLRTVGSKWDMTPFVK